MKRIFRLLTIVAATVMTFTLTSCDEDQQIAMQLQGYWRGQIKQQDFYSRWNLTSTNYFTVFHFTGDLGSRHGYGYEIDYNSYRSYDYYNERFEYWVKGEVISLTYMNGTKAEIRNYRLTENTFDGYIDYWNGREENSVHFLLDRDDNFNDDPYMHGFYYN